MPGGWAEKLEAMVILHGMNGLDLLLILGTGFGTFFALSVLTRATRIKHARKREQARGAEWYRGRVWYPWAKHRPEVSGLYVLSDSFGPQTFVVRVTITDAGISLSRPQGYPGIKGLAVSRCKWTGPASSDHVAAGVARDIRAGADWRSGLSEIAEQQYQGSAEK